MKTKCQALFMSALFICSLLPLSELYAQDLEQVMTSRLDVIDTKDWQVLDSDTYRLGDETLYDNPNAIRLFPDEFYRFRLRFTYFGDNNETVTAKNYLGKRYALQIPTSDAGNYRVTAISPSADTVSIFVVASGEPSVRDTFRVQLLDEMGSTLSEVVYPFEILTDDPDATSFASLPMIMQDLTPLYVTLEDVNNPRNRIERVLLPEMPDTINIDARDAYKMMMEIEQTVWIGNESYVLVANHEKDYGFHVNYEWYGQALQDKPIDKNGLQAYLTAVPSKRKPTRPQLTDLNLVAVYDLQKSGLTHQNRRLKPKYQIATPSATTKKVYTTDYIKAHPDAVRMRTRPANQEITKQYATQLQSRLLQVQDQPILYKLDAKVLTPATKTTPTTTTTPTKAQIQTKKYSAKEKTAVSKTATTRTATRATTRPPTRTAPSATRRPTAPVQTEKPRQTVTILEEKPGKYYTMAIEVQRETDMMSHRTYLVTFRLIE